jgi:hypothetical protein
MGWLGFVVSDWEFNFGFLFGFSLWLEIGCGEDF